MTFNLFMKRYWRIPVVALLAAILAFGASYVETPTYQATSRLLIVEGSTNLLNSSGQPVSDQAGVDDATSAETLSETQAGLASSRAVATIVVDKLHLATPKPARHGAIHWIEASAASAYAHLRAWVTSGFYKTPAPREKAIQTTEAAIAANDLAPTGGPDSGQTDSYILELDATGDTALQATQIANTAANALITVSRQRFALDSRYYAKALSTQLRSANATLASANRAVSNYELVHNVSSIDQQLIQNVQNSGTLKAQLVAADAAVQGDKQTLASLQATLAGTDPTEISDQSITTGRSTTADDTTQANPVYQTVESQVSQAKATLASDTATVVSLRSQVQANPSDALTRAQAGLLDLEQKVTADQNSVNSLSSSLQQADANIQISPVDLSRLGRANIPTYPASPKRDLYLLLGLILGALAGCWLTYRARRRLAPPEERGEEPEPFTPRTAEYDFTGLSDHTQYPIPVGFHAGNNQSPGETVSNGSNHHGGENASLGHQVGTAESSSCAIASDGDGGVPTQPFHLPQTFDLDLSRAPKDSAPS